MDFITNAGLKPKITCNLQNAYMFILKATGFEERQATLSKNLPKMTLKTKRKKKEFKCIKFLLFVA